MLARGGSIQFSFSIRQLSVHILALSLTIRCVTGWKVNYVPNHRLSVLEDSDVVRFGGGSSTPDFSVALVDGDSLFLGARNVFYNLNVNTLTPIKTLSWPANDVAAQTCTSGLQKSQDECQNYIHVMAKWSSTEIIACGTNALRPECRVYKNSPHYDVLSTRPGVAICPFSADDPFTLTVVDKTIYSATYTDLSSTDPLIYNGNIRTEQYDVRWFNEPQFVSSFEYGDKVYFFFRETALEHSNCGKTVYSRVARVCKSDTGGRTILQDRFTSFLKARLNCTVPGDQDFTFNEIVATSSVGRGSVGGNRHAREAQDMIYALFRTPQNSITGSAICAFRLRDVMSAFRSKVMTQSDPNSHWKAINSPYTDIDECADDSKTVPDAQLNFVRSHPLMEQAVMAQSGRPLYINTELGAKMTKLAVDWQIAAADGRYYDILYVGTDDGRVLKAYNKNSNLNNPDSTVVVEEITVSDTAILDLKIHPQGQGQGRPKLLVTSKNQVVSLPLHRCVKMKTCEACVRLQDPYCSWLPGQGCRNSRNGYQNLMTGKDSRCPSTSGESNKEPTVKPVDCSRCQDCKAPNNNDNKLPTSNNNNNNNNNNGQKPSVGDPRNNTIKSNVPASMGASQDRLHGGITLFTVLGTALASAVVSALVFFSLGYCAAYKKHSKQNSNIKYLDKLSDTSERSKRVNVSNYVQTPGPKPLNVLMNVAPKPPNKYTVPSPVPEHKTQMTVHLPQIPDRKGVDHIPVVPAAKKAYV